MKLKNTARASHSWYYYHFHQIRVVLFINSSRTVVFPILIVLSNLLNKLSFTIPKNIGVYRG